MMKKPSLPCLLLSLWLTDPAAADLFLVTTSEGPGFTAPEDVDAVVEQGILPTFDMLMDLKAKKKIVAGMGRVFMENDATTKSGGSGGNGAANPQVP